MLREQPGAAAKPRRAERATFRLTPEEAATLRGLLPREGAFFAFLEAVAAARGLDYRTIISNPNDRDSFTALPPRHGRHWCWPMALRCTRAPPQFIDRAA